MQIEVGKYYRTRDGRRVGPITTIDSNNIALSCDITGIRNGWWADCGLGEKGQKLSDDLVAEWTDGPVRIVERKEIVEGVYGRLTVDGLDRGGLLLVRLRFGADSNRFEMHDAADLRSIIATLTEIADALEGK